MTAPTITDKISTPIDGKSRRIDEAQSAESRHRGDENSALPSASGRDSADISRASQRLAQGMSPVGESQVASTAQARDRVAQLQLEISRDPASVISAFKEMNANSFLAAIAEPSD